jgi:UDP-3-O-[3-hydroxymyristoyl] glucosamine N-acyltransferase
VAIPLRGASLAGLAAAFGGEVRGRAALDVGRFVPIEEARAGDLAPFVRGSLRGEAARALARGAALLVTPELDAQARTDGARGSVWVHSHAAWAMAKVLAAHAVVTDDLATLAPDAVLGAHVSLAPRVVVGARVTIGASSVIGSPGFGWATGPGGEVVRSWGGSSSRPTWRSGRS